MAAKVKYILNLPSIFDRAYSSKEQAFRSKLRPVISDPFFKRAYALAVIDEIRNRTESKIDKNGDPMPFYTKAYAKSLAGQVYGKSARQRADLLASGEMLSSMVSRETSQPKISIEMADQFNNDKAHGHIYGYKNRSESKRKDFLGLPNEVEEKLMKNVIKDINNQSASSTLAAAFEVM